MFQLLRTANIFLTSPIVTLNMEAIRSSETSVLTRFTRYNNPQYGIFILTGVNISYLT
jgi:hypothetical protein